MPFCSINEFSQVLSLSRERASRFNLSYKARVVSAYLRTFPFSSPFLFHLTTRTYFEAKRVEHASVNLSGLLLRREIVRLCLLNENCTPPCRRCNGYSHATGVGRGGGSSRRDRKSAVCSSPTFQIARRREDIVATSSATLRRARRYVSCVKRGEKFIVTIMCARAFTTR